MKVLPKTLFYCQHVLGVGHLARSLELLRALKDRHQIHFVHGGEPAPGFPFPSNTKVIELPPLSSSDDFVDVLPASDGHDLAWVREERRRLLLEELDTFDPDLVVIELFPFGRKRFAFELLPLLVRLRLRGRRAKVACSLRDILVAKGDQVRFERRAVRLMNRYFDLLAVHTDPRFQDLGESFGRVKDLECKVCSTGYVSQPLPEVVDESGVDSELAELGSVGPLIVASVGGGKVGHELLEATLLASSLLAERLPHRLLVLAGVYAEEEQLARLTRLARNRPQVAIRRHSERFLQILTRSQLSVSLAGYNTCMNLIAVGVPSLLLPFAGGNNNEQAIRAVKLERLGAGHVLSSTDLEPARLAALMARQLESQRTSIDLRLDGARFTADLFGEILSAPAPVAGATRWGAIRSPSQSSSIRRARCILNRELASLEAKSRCARVFLRVDDVDEDDEPLRQLLELSIEHRAALNLEAIPGSLTEEAVDLLKDQWTCDPALLEVHQHGFLHENHEREGRKQEFGPSRPLALQRADIERGRKRLSEAFEERFFPLFTPPWNRCTEGTCALLDELGFKVLSRDLTAYRAAEGNRGTWKSLQEIPIAVDLHHWKQGPRLRSPEEVSLEIAASIQQLEVVGILLHHKVMDEEAFAWLDGLLCELRCSSAVTIHKLSSLQGVGV